MIVGTGIDLVEVERLGERISSNAALKSKIFSVDECRYCEQRPNSKEHFAARFAAKEAFLKATGLGLTAGHDLYEIEVVSDEIGKPKLRLSGNMQRLAVENNWSNIHVTLSHVRDVACAMVIIER